MDTSSVSVLVVFANPIGTDPLRLEAEDRIIREAIRRSRFRDDIALTICHATTVHDLREYLLDANYDIVHISGHGNGSGLALENEQGGLYVVPQKALADLLRAYTPPEGTLRCIILNACYSVAQGNLLSLDVPITIAMEGPIGDNAAIEFSRGFYDAIGSGHNFEFAYEEGCRSVALAAPSSQFVSRMFLRQQAQLADSEELNDGSAISTYEPIQFKSVQALAGFAIDVSGSMQESIRNNSRGNLSRLESFRRSFDHLTREARNALEQSKARQMNTSIDLFAYGFGLRILGVCDLFSLIQVGQQVISKAEIEDLKSRYTNEAQQRYKGYGGLGDLARQFGLGGLADSAAATIRAQAEAQIRGQIMRDISTRLEKQLRSAGDTTLSIDEVVQLWDGSEDTLTSAEELIYGDTPMTAALTQVADRFERELRNRPNDTQAILFVLSDGAPTDGNPSPAAERLKSLGVRIISCFVTNEDIADPKTLFGSPEQRWTSGAQLMFAIASLMGDDVELTGFMLRNGWTINQGAKLFVQLNHSAILEEFIRVVLSPLQESPSGSLLPRGI